MVVAENESELSIDIVDVLSECPPESDTLTMEPFRESYRTVLPSLPQQTDDLSVLFIPTARLVTLIRLVQGVQLETTEDLVASIEKLGSDGKISWKTFDSAMSEHSVSCLSENFGSCWIANIYEQELIADGLSKIFQTFTVA
jgi:hypothetical protein